MTWPSPDAIVSRRWLFVGKGPGSPEQLDEGFIVGDQGGDAAVVVLE